MIALPIELAPWEDELALVPRDVALAIGPWIGRLALAIGPMASGARRGDAEPDGIGAIARRGSYERLLASEWLLADELPDEFLRRAAGGEHLFFELARRAPGASPRSIVLFDAGPSQIGAPRIAHVALAIVLARRAREAGARLSWGILQRPGDGLRDALDAEALGAILAARSALEPSAAWLDEWAALAREDPHAEPWVIGAPRSTAPLVRSGLAAIAIVDPLDPDRAWLRARVERRGRAAIQLELELPPDPRACARLLRDPTRSATAPPATEALPPHAWFGFPADGRRLAAVSRGTYLSWGLPSSPRGTVGAPRRLRLPEGDTTLAVGHKGRALIAVTLRGDVVRVIGTDGVRAERELAPGEGARWRDAAADATLRTAAFVVQTPHHQVLAFLALDRALCMQSLGLIDVGGRWLHDVLDFAPLRSGCAVVQHAQGSEDSTTVATVEGIGGARKVVHSVGSEAHAAMFASCEGAHAIVALARERTLRAWRLVDIATGSHVELEAPSGTRVIGAHADGRRGRGLVIVEPGGRAVSFVGAQQHHAIASASGAIHVAACSPRGGMVAWRTTDGWLEVASIAHAGIVLRIPPEPPRNAA